MKLTIEGSPKEIAALVSELQERQEMTLDSIVKDVVDGFKKATLSSRSLV